MPQRWQSKNKEIPHQKGHNRIYETNETNRNLFLSWALKTIEGLEAYQLTLQDNMYYDHGLLMSQRTEIHLMVAGDVNLQLRLKDAVLRAFADHGI